LTSHGRGMAMRVMRKHRLAECLLVDIIGMPWEEVHPEACRWEHVMSENVERRILDLLKHPTHSPFGNPIPGLDELGDAGVSDDGALVGLDVVAGAEPQRVTVRRIGEPIQDNQELMTTLSRAGVLPGQVVKVTVSEGGVMVGSGMEYAELDTATASHVFVSAR